MKKIIILAFLAAGSGGALAQVCSADFGYSIGSNNNVTFNSTNIINGCTPSSQCCVSMNYGDSLSGKFNIWSPSGWNHFYRYPGIYEPCITMSYQDGMGCSCSDTTCHQITIADTGSFCQASYCYEAVLDTNGLLQVSFTNTSTSDDSITNVYWDFNDGAQSIDYHVNNYWFVMPVPDQLTYLYIQTASGCQSAIVDTLVVGNTCDTTTSISVPLTDPNLDINIYPNPFTLQTTLEFDNPNKEPHTLTLHDIQGRLLRTVTNITSDEVIFQREALSNGVYFFELQTEEQVIGTGKVIIQ